MVCKVFGVGLPKTGTSSLNEALIILGYNSLHNPHYLRKNQFYADWFKNVEFDAIANFAERTYPYLDIKFPYSKFILTVRDKDKWLKSIEYQLGGIPEKRLSNLIRVDIFGTLCFDREWFSYLWDNHIKQVKEHFKGSDRLLVLDIDKDDCWNKICVFLGKDIPDMGFPHKNKTNG